MSVMSELTLIASSFVDLKPIAVSCTSISARFSGVDIAMFFRTALSCCGTFDLVLAVVVKKIFVAFLNET